MKFQSINQVMTAFEKASLSAGHSRNTRNGYMATVKDFTVLLIDRRISGPQGYFDYLSQVKKICPASVWHAMGGMGTPDPFAKLGTTVASETIIPFRKHA